MTLTFFPHCSQGPPNTVQKGDAVLVWGGSGGLGAQAIRLVRNAGGIPVAVVSDDERGEYRKKYGAVRYINRKEFGHWGVPPHWEDAAGQKMWMDGARAFGKKFWDVVGEKRSLAIVFEHPGESTIPTSIFLCETGGMVVICACTNDTQARAYNDLVCQKKIDPCLSSLIPFEEIPQAHYEMMQGREVYGNRALVGAKERGQGIRS